MELKQPTDSAVGDNAVSGHRTGAMGAYQQHGTVAWKANKMQWSDPKNIETAMQTALYWRGSGVR